MIGILVVIGVLVLILLARYTGLGRDWWPRDPFSNCPTTRSGPDVLTSVESRVNLPNFASQTQASVLLEVA